MSSIPPVDPLIETLYQLLSSLLPQSEEKGEKESLLFTAVASQLSSLLADRSSESLGDHDVKVLIPQASSSTSTSQSREKERAAKRDASTGISSTKNGVAGDPLANRRSAEPKLATMSQKWLEQVKTILDDLSSIIVEVKPNKTISTQDSRYLQLVETIRGTLQGVTPKNREGLALKCEEKHLKSMRFSQSSGMPENQRLSDTSELLKSPVHLNKSSSDLSASFTQGEKSLGASLPTDSRPCVVVPHLQPFIISSVSQRSKKERKKERKRQDGEEEQPHK